MKKTIWQKRHVILFFGNPLAYCVPFTPNLLSKGVIFQKIHIVGGGNIQFIPFNHAFYVFESSLYYNHHNYNGNVIVIPSAIILALG
jgi:hypothetical protein